MSLNFRWLGVAGVELKAGNQILAIDPFFTRPSLRGFFRPVNPDPVLIAKKLPVCNYVLVTHSHWDHLMDVPEVVRHTDAIAFGSPNTCQLMRIQGVPETHVKEVNTGDRISLGAFKVEVVPGRHSWIPFARVFNGSLKADLKPPLRLQDYRMDICLGYCINVMGMRLLICAANPQGAQALFIVAQEPKRYYLELFRGVQPHTVVFIHWDNFLQPLGKSQTRFTRPGRMALWHLAMLARNELPHARVIIPEIFRSYQLRPQG